MNLSEKFEKLPENFVKEGNHLNFAIPRGGTTKIFTHTAGELTNKYPWTRHSGALRHGTRT